MLGWIGRLLAFAAGKPMRTSGVNNSTGLLTQTVKVRGRLHSDGDLPAVTELHPVTAQPVRLMFYRHGKLHRDNGAAYTEFSPITGRAVLEVFCRDGRLYAPDGSPAAIDYEPATGKRIEYDLRRPGSPPLVK